MRRNPFLSNRRRRRETRFIVYVSIATFLHSLFFICKKKPGNVCFVLDEVSFSFGDVMPISNCNSAGPVRRCGNIYSIVCWAFCVTARLLLPFLLRFALAHCHPRCYLFQAKKLLFNVTGKSATVQSEAEPSNGQFLTIAPALPILPGAPVPQKLVKRSYSSLG